MEPEPAEALSFLQAVSRSTPANRMDRVLVQVFIGILDFKTGAIGFRVYNVQIVCLNMPKPGKIYKIRVINYLEEPASEGFSVSLFFSALMVTSTLSILWASISMISKLNIRQVSLSPVWGMRSSR